MAERVYLNTMGLICASGQGGDDLFAHFRRNQSQLAQNSHQQTAALRTSALGTISSPLPNIKRAGPHCIHNTRNNQVAMAALLQIDEAIFEAIADYDTDRIGVVIGTSTSGIAQTEVRLSAELQEIRPLPAYHYEMQEMAAPAHFIAEHYGLAGPCYGISTACTSGAKAIASARRLILAGFCDAVIAGGVDTLCQLTLQGFASLGALSDQLCNPLSLNRAGINIGEAATFFLMSKEKKGVALGGIGESSDAHHISAPDPSGKGAKAAMNNALQDAGLSWQDIDYINLHGTATILNDAMEAAAIHDIFGDTVWCSSTKPFTGHTLGAAGALEAGICWQTLMTSEGFLPPHRWDQVQDPALPYLKLTPTDNLENHQIQVKRVLSNSFAFGGNNIALILEALDAE